MGKPVSPHQVFSIPLAENLNRFEFFPLSPEIQ